MNLSPKCNTREPRQSVLQQQQQRPQKIQRDSQQSPSQSKPQIFNETIDLYLKKCNDLSMQIAKQNSSKLSNQKDNNAQRSASKVSAQQYETNISIQMQPVPLLQQRQSLSKSSVNLTNSQTKQNTQLSKVLEQTQEIHAYKLAQQAELLEIEEMIQLEKQAGERLEQKGQKDTQQANSQQEINGDVGDVQQQQESNKQSEKTKEEKPKKSQQRALKDSKISAVLLDVMKNNGKNQKNIKKDIKKDNHVEDKIREEKQLGGRERNTKELASHADEPSIQELTRDLKKYLAEQQLQNTIEPNAASSEKLECSERVIQQEEGVRRGGGEKQQKEYRLSGGFMDRNQKWLEAKQRKRQQQQDHTSFTQMKECTFAPLTNSSKKLATQGERKREKQGMLMQRNMQPIHLQTNQQGEIKRGKQIKDIQQKNRSWNCLKPMNKEQSLHEIQTEGKVTPFGLTPLPSPIYSQFVAQSPSQTTSVHQRKFSRESQDQSTSELKKDIEDVLGILQNFL